MNNGIRIRATSYNVTSQIQRAKRPLYHLHHHPPHYNHPKPSPRPFTTTHPLRDPTQTSPLNIEIYLPERTTGTKPLPTLLQATTNSPVIKPITAHHDLTSYLTQQHHRILAAPTTDARKKLTTSSVHLGTRYEYLIQSHFQRHLGFTLTRIGGKGDGGVDLIGSWTLPVPIPVTSSPSSPSSSSSDLNSTTPTNPPFHPTFRILLQAKRIAPHRNPMPALMRELDGTILSSSTSRWISAAFAMHGVRTAALTLPPTQSQSCPPKNNTQTPPSSDPNTTHTNHEPSSDAPLSDLSHLPTLGILVTTRPLTSGIEKAMASSRRCLMYVCLEEVEDPTMHETANELHGVLNIPSTKIRQMTWNSAASRAGLEGYDVVTKYNHNDNRDVPMDGEATMMFQGHPVRPP